MQKVDYSISLHAYEANSRIEKREDVQFHVNRGSYIGGRTRFARYANDEEAIAAGKKLWKDATEFNGTVRQLIVRRHNDVVFKIDTFNQIGL